MKFRGVLGVQLKKDQERLLVADTHDRDGDADDEDGYGKEDAEDQLKVDQSSAAAAAAASNHLVLNLWPRRSGWCQREVQGGVAAVRVATAYSKFVRIAVALNRPVLGLQKFGIHAAARK